MSRKRPLEPLSPELSPMPGLSEISGVTAEQYSRTLNESLDTLASSSGGFKFPWEQGYLRAVFGSMPVLDDPPVPSLLSAPGSVFQDPSTIVAAQVLSVPGGAGGKITETPLFEKHIRRAPDVDFTEQRKLNLEIAIQRWWRFLKIDLSCSEIGRVVRREAPVADMDAYAQEVLSAVFSNKSPATLLKRVGALEAYVKWGADNLFAGVLPLREVHGWQYLSHLSMSQAAPTKSSTFLEACRFCHHLLGVEGAKDVADSVRNTGSAAKNFVRKRAWQPAAVLTVEEVLSLHAVLMTEEVDLVDRVFAGHFLHMLYSRSRWSDLLSVRGLHCDEPDVLGYLEVGSTCHKSAKSSLTKSMLLPIVAPCLGVDKTPWAGKYLEVRRLAGLDTVLADSACMLPAPEPISGKWCKRYVTSAEGAGMLRAFLGISGKDRKVTTHSLKATGISWCSKSGVPREVKEILGRHASATLGSTQLYSRDILSPALRSFDLVLKSIREGSFKPDCTRSGMFVASPVPLQPADGPVAESQSLLEPKLELELAMSEVSGDMEAVEIESSVSSTSSEEESDEEETVAMPESPEPERGDFYIHVKSWVVHKILTGQKTECGRIIGVNYSGISEPSGFQCRKCFAEELRSA